MNSLTMRGSVSWRQRLWAYRLTLARVAVVVAIVANVASVCWARGGGGCLVTGTLVSTPRGPVPIEQLEVGDEVVAATGRPERVVDVIAVAASMSYEVSAGLRATADHPFLVGPGRWLPASALGHPVVQPVQAFNLIVAPSGTFVAAGRVTHNKGCFLPDTRVELADGTSRAISTLRVGERVRAWSQKSGAVVGTVMATHEYAVDEYFVLTTSAGAIRVTRDHLFAMPNGEFRSAWAINAGDTLLVVGPRGLTPTRVADIKTVAQPTHVYNILTDWPQSYLAESHLVHNKGCFLPETRVLYADGRELPIADVKPGDQLRAFAPTGELVVATVNRAFSVESDHYYEVTTAGGVMVRATAEHPFYVGSGSFRIVEQLQPGDTVFTCREALAPDTVRQVRKVSEKVRVFNLETDQPHTFVANGMAVHNKGGGCFAAGTPVGLPGGGTKPIETLAPGDVITAGDGRPVRVRSIAVSRDELVALTTSLGTLWTTREHPILGVRGNFHDAGRLSSRHALRTGDGGAVAVADVAPTGRHALVYEIEVDAPHTYVAGGIVVHNKGGWGGSRGGGGGGDAGDLVFIMIFGGIFLVAKVAEYAQNRTGSTGFEEELDVIIPTAKIETKAKETSALLARVAANDPECAEKNLTAAAEKAFLTLQRVWEKRDYAEMAPLVTAGIRSSHETQLRGMVRQREINIMGDIKVEMVRVIHIFFPKDPKNYEFTVLIQAKARDYTVDDTTRKFKRGDSCPQRFQEFWTFRRLDGDTWLLCRISQTRESRSLQQSNVAMAVGGAAAASAAPGDGEALGGATDTLPSDGKIVRMMRSFSLNDPLWEVSPLQERVSSAAIAFHAALETREMGDLNTLATDDFKQFLTDEWADRAARGERVEFRNLCVRDVEFVMARKRSSKNPDEFLARVAVHAERSLYRGESTAVADRQVRKFDLMLRFRRDGAEFKLAELVPPGSGAPASNTD